MREARKEQIYLLGLLLDGDGVVTGVSFNSMLLNVGSRSISFLFRKF
jgi:hypothetical protein